MRYVEGENRDQLIMFPESLNDYVQKNSLVCFIEEFANGLDLAGLGFKYAVPSVLGRRSYDPADMLKLYIYGYHNYIRSSRRLEKETRRNVEVMWLLKNLTPDDKTISNFRKDNRKKIKSVFREFNLICQELSLIKGKVLGVDGSKFRAQNSKDRNLNKKKLKDKLERIDRKVESYLEEMDRNDENEPDEPRISVDEMNRKIRQLKQRRKEHEEKLDKLNQSGQKQMSLTDPDSRLMKNKGRSEVCFNVQTVVDSKSKMIVEYEVTNEETDSRLLHRMAKQAKESLELEGFSVLADSGYHNGPGIKECIDNGITPFIPHRSFPGGRNGFPKDGYHKEDFRYDPRRDVYVCPCGYELNFQRKEKSRGKTNRIYKCDNFNECDGYCNCTASKKGRTVKRWVHENVLEDMAVRVSKNPALMKKRKEICEHPFGTLKRGFNSGYFLTRGLDKTNAEMGFSALTYNIKRAGNTIGYDRLIEGVRALREGAIDRLNALKKEIERLFEEKTALEAS